MDRTEVLGAGLQRGRVNELANSALQRPALRAAADRERSAPKRTDQARVKHLDRRRRDALRYVPLRGRERQLSE